ncbi:MAG: hypothetical protein JXQ30_01230 [Spirochaetes bacterium]|nr:hypothetical protein [Spirochaetota bacterium]
MRGARTLLLCMVLLAVAACARIRVQPPDGFAEWKSGRFIPAKVCRAVSPEGIELVLWSVKNYPPQDLEFWKEALFSHLEEEGYLPAGEPVPFETKAAGVVRDGVLFEWVVGYGEEDYVYCTAIIPSKRRIAIVEAAGKYGIYTEYRDAILSSLETVTFR